jgi:hypothetical protein
VPFDVFENAARKETVSEKGDDEGAVHSPLVVRWKMRRTKFVTRVRHFETGKQLLKSSSMELLDLLICICTGSYITSSRHMVLLRRMTSDLEEHELAKASQVRPRFYLAPEVDDEGEKRQRL